MKRKSVFYSEIAYILGIIILALGASLMERAGLGMSMVITPAYLIHLKVSQYLPFFTFGMSEYVFQAFLLCVLTLVMRKFRKGYIFSFVTALIYGFVLDALMSLVALFPYETILWRIIFYAVGLVASSIGVALLFHTYLPPEAYELFVKEISQRLHMPIAKFKTIYDCCSCAVSIVLSFAFFGFGVFVGVELGTVICALINGFLIGRIGAFLEKRFVFKDALPLKDKLN